MRDWELFGVSCLLALVAAACGGTHETMEDAQNSAVAEPVAEEVSASRLECFRQLALATDDPVVKALVKTPEADGAALSDDEAIRLAAFLQRAARECPQ